MLVLRVHRHCRKPLRALRDRELRCPPLREHLNGRAVGLVQARVKLGTRPRPRLKRRDVHGHERGVNDDRRGGRQQQVSCLCPPRVVALLGGKCRELRVTRLAEAAVETRGVVRRDVHAHVVLDVARRTALVIHDDVRRRDKRLQVARVAPRLNGRHLLEVHPQCAVAAAVVLLKELADLVVAAPKVAADDVADDEAPHVLAAPLCAERNERGVGACPAVLQQVRDVALCVHGVLQADATHAVTAEHNVREVDEAPQDALAHVVVKPHGQLVQLRSEERLRREHCPRQALLAEARRVHRVDDAVAGVRLRVAEEADRAAGEAHNARAEHEHRVKCRLRVRHRVERHHCAARQDLHPRALEQVERRALIERRQHAVVLLVRHVRLALARAVREHLALELVAQQVVGVKRSGQHRGNEHAVQRLRRGHALRGRVRSRCERVILLLRGCCVIRVILRWRLLDKAAPAPLRSTDASLWHKLARGQLQTPHTAHWFFVVALGLAHVLSVLSFKRLRSGNVFVVHDKHLRKGGL